MYNDKGNDQCSINKNCDYSNRQGCECDGITERVLHLGLGPKMQLDDSDYDAAGVAKKDSSCFR